MKSNSSKINVFFCKGKNVLKKGSVIFLVALASLLYPIQKVNASIEAGIIGGAVVGTGLATAWLLGCMGLTGASDSIYDSVDNLREWGNEKVAEIKEHAMKTGVQTGVGIVLTAKQIGKWFDDLGQGIVDTASDVWKAVKDYVSNVFKSTPLDATALTFVTNLSGPVVGYHSTNKYLELKLGFKFKGDSYHGSPVDSFEFSQPVALIAEKGWSNPYARAVSSTPFSITIKSGSKSSVVDITSPSVTSNNFKYYYYRFDTYITSGNSYIFNKPFVSLESHSEFEPYIEKNLTLKREWSIPQSGTLEHWKTNQNLNDFTFVGNKGNVGTIPLKIPNVNTIPNTLEDLKNGTLTWDDVMTQTDVTATDGDKVLDKDGVTDIPVTDIVNVPLDDTEVKKYKVELKSIFPFCIPFDLIDFLGVLSAEPQAPRWEIPIEYPVDLQWNKATYNLVIDLSQFDKFAQMIRDVEIFAFTVGLILLTRSIIRS